MHYVVGDVHGCFDDLMAMIETIEKRDEDATIIFVGDFIDRGSQVWETLNWCRNNITADGKYQSVLGNHEDLVMQWYYEFKNSSEKKISNLPPLYYGFEQILIENGIEYIDEVAPIVELFETLPLYKKIDVTMVSGRPQTYYVAHAYMPKDGPRQEDSDNLKRRAEYLLSRQHIWGYQGEGILVHGHTPTINYDYGLRGPLNPGFIAYRQNAINIDGGCAYLSTDYTSGPCMLCAICLETLEEIYPYSWEDRMSTVEFYELDNHSEFGMDKEEFRKLLANNWVNRIKERNKRLESVDVAERVDMLVKTGLLAEGEVPDNILRKESRYI